MPEATNLDNTPKIFIALDVDDASTALSLVEMLKGLPVHYKVGMQLAYASKFSVIEKIKNQGHELFLDLKLYDIPETVKKASRIVCDLGVDYFTVHLSGGQKMIEQTKEAIYKHSKNPPKILGVSVLTSFSQTEYQNIFPLKVLPIHEHVEFLVDQGVLWGVDGIVCSPLEVASIYKKHPKLFTMIPGIRPEGVDHGDQKRVMTPRQAQLAGASALVIGRPITEAKDPKAVVENILNSLGNKDK